MNGGMLAIQRGNEVCVQCRQPVGLHGGIEAIDCLVKLAQDEQDEVRERCPHCGAICDDEECQCDRDVCTSFTKVVPNGE